MLDFWEAAERNKRKTVFLIFSIAAVFVLMVYVFAKLTFPGLAGFAVIASVILVSLQVGLAVFRGSNVVLWYVKAYPLPMYRDREKIAQVENDVEGLSIAAGIPKPKIFVFPSPQINAFATGFSPEKSVIALSEGALEKLDRKELEGVIAHEISHIANYDTRLATVVTVLVGLVAILADMMIRTKWDDDSPAWMVILGIALAVFAPIAVRLVQLAISREREYLADATGARLTRYPEGLASALEKIKEDDGKMKVSEAVSHMFIADPVRTALDSVFSTHPPIDKRIERLRKMAGEF